MQHHPVTTPFFLSYPDDIFDMMEYRYKHDHLSTPGAPVMNRKHAIIGCIAAVCFSLLLTCTESVAPFLISDSEEVQLGKKFKAEIVSDTATYPPFHGDARISNYVDSLGHIISNAQKDRDTLTFTFTIIAKDEINAFAIPGGHVFVYTGLLKSAASGAEVAGVLAHEIGHITKYHGRNQLLKQSAVGYVNSILFGDSSSIAGAVAGLLENMVFLSFSRDNEYQADSCAVAYATMAGINPAGMELFLKKLKDKYGDDPPIFEPFSTHPPTSERIDRVDKLINSLSGAKMGSDEKMFTNEYAVIKGLL